MLKKTKAQLVAATWTLLIATSCLLPASTFREFSFDSLIGIDKIVHLSIYFGFIVLWALVRPKLNAQTRYLLLFIGIGYGILIEVLQAKMSLGRSYDIADIIANTVGCILGLFSINFIRKNLPLLKKYLPFLNKLY